MTRNAISNQLYKISPVEDFTIFSGFFCCAEEEDDDLDDFIHNDAERHLRDRMAVTYGVFFVEDGDLTQPIAFVTLQNDALKVKGPGYKYKTTPAVKIGRFGVRREFQRLGVGTHVLTMIKTLMCTKNRTGCRYVTLDAYNKPKVIDFYTKKNGFIFLKEPNPDRPQEGLYFDLLRHLAVGGE